MEERIFWNGIDGVSGDYSSEALTSERLAEVISQETLDEEKAKLLQSLFRHANQPHLGLAFDLDPTKIEEAGWGIVFHQNESHTVKDTVQRLIDHRQTQIKNSDIVRILEYRDRESLQEWLARHGVAAGTVDPRKVPLYLLLIGSPENIPIEFGQLLDVEYCVGRLDFSNLDDLKQYIDSVIRYENDNAVPNSNEAFFFGPCHPHDLPTKVSSEFLVKPLSEGNGHRSLLERISRSSGVSYTARRFEPEICTKERLVSIFRADSSKGIPAFLFTASHGLSWPLNHSKQVDSTGAIVCQDFKTTGQGALPESQYFAAADLPADAQVHGLVCFHFACFGAGTPREDLYFHRSGMVPPQIAPRPFFSALPKALLSHRNGGALGVIGHVERAWMSSVTMPNAGVQLQPFENTIGFILTGKPLGYALRDFNERYAALSTSIASLLRERGFGLTVSNGELIYRWLQRNDAGAYVLLGDPGVRLRTDKLR